MRKFIKDIPKTLDILGWYRFQLFKGICELNKFNQLSTIVYSIDGAFLHLVGFVFGIAMDGAVSFGNSALNDKMSRTAKRLEYCHGNPAELGS